jgi:hypothetical protein
VSASEPDTGVGEAACVLWFGQRLTPSPAPKTDPASGLLLPIRGEYPLADLTGRIDRALPGQRPSWTNNQAKFNRNSWPLQGLPAGLQARSVHSIAAVAIVIGRRTNS